MERGSGLSLAGCVSDEVKTAYSFGGKTGIRSEYIIDYILLGPLDFATSVLPASPY